MTDPARGGNPWDPTGSTPQPGPVWPAPTPGTQPGPAWPAPQPGQTWPTPQPGPTQAYPEGGYVPPPYYGYGQPVQPRSTNGLAIAALVCSLLGPCTFVSAIAGVILGYIARAQIRRTGESGAGMALAGIIVGWVVIGLIAFCVGGPLLAGTGLRPF